MKPSDFMIGLINLLSILLPGAIATTLLLHVSPELRALSDSLPRQDAFAWIAFFAVSYFGGHLIFLAGSWLDPFYDWVRKRLNPDLRLKDRDKSRLDPLIDSVRMRYRDWKKRNDEPEEQDDPPIPPYKVANALRRRVSSDMEFRASNAFQWCRSILIQHSPEAYRDIEIHEADQKFFRSLVILALAVSVGALVTSDWYLLLIALAAAIVSFVRYYGRRQKTTKLAYLHVLTLHRIGKLDFRPRGPDAGS